MKNIFDEFDRTSALPEDESEYVRYLRQVAQDKIAPRAEDFDRSGEFPWANVKLLNELGMNGVFVPEEYGGNPLSYTCYLELVRELSRACPATAITWATTFHAIAPLLVFGTDEQKRRYLPGIAAGGLAAVAITEPTGGSDATAMRSTLRESGPDTLVLDGGKIFITNGDVAEVIVVFAKWPGAERARDQLTCVLLDANTPGLVVVRKEDKLGHRASSTAELRYDGCEIPRGNVLGELGGGFRVLLAMLNRSRPSVAAQALGVALAAFDEAQRHVNERRQFGQRILDFQGVQFMFADMATSLITGLSLLRHVGALVDAGETDFDVVASILKLTASDAAMSIAANGVQLQGGYGYMSGNRAERLFRDAKLTQIWEGANELHRARIGKSFLSQVTSA